MLASVLGGQPGCCSLLPPGPASRFRSVRTAPCLAAPIAYEPPSISRAWDAFLVHVPTLLPIWIVTIVIAGVGVVASMAITVAAVSLASGFGSGAEEASSLVAILAKLVQWPFTILSNLVGVLFVVVPALHYASGKTIDTEAAFRVLMDRPVRYLLAGALFTIAATAGLVLCVLPGVAVALVMPVFVNQIFLSDRPILKAFSSSFQAVYGSPAGRRFAGLELLAGLLVLVVAACTCGLGALVAIPMAAFYIQNAAYHRGVLT